MALPVSVLSIPIQASRMSDAAHGALRQAPRDKVYLIVRSLLSQASPITST